MNKLERILDILPQTQCGLCQHKGCKPYAEALVNEQDTIEKCHPGGVETLEHLGKILAKDPSPYLKEVRAREVKSSVVIIDEPACIGCTKCIQACPVDAIFGTAKANHVVIASECTGCNLCIPVCPVDCIHEVSVPINKISNHYRRERYEQRQQRLATLGQAQKARHRSNKDRIRQKLAEIKNADKTSK